MQTIHSIELIHNSQEEQLPGFSPEFPYIASRAELDHYLSPTVPWHWHRCVELFLVESGTLEYTTPAGSVVFSAGSGGFVNSNVLHTSRRLHSGNATVQLLHLFEPELISGGFSRLDSKYIRPLICSPGIEILAFSPQNPAHGPILQKIQNSFTLSESDWGYELCLRQQLTEIWLDLFALAQPDMTRFLPAQDPSQTLKTMMQYIHTHFSESISTEQLAGIAHISKRSCYRQFQENLHMSPGEYITGYRLERACVLLAQSREPITQIAYRCGFGSGSYFGLRFRETFGCSPAQYRQSWHDRDSILQK